jgi:parvulin-like peptidyl-prolyl isomerase
MKNRMMAAVACTFAAACSDANDGTGLVARVDEYELSVDEVVELLVDEEGLAADQQVVRTLADFWIDYALLADAAADDTTFAQIDLEPMVQEQLSQNMVFQLRDSVIQIDTFITESELEGLYEAEAPEVEVRARHILLGLPLQATQAQRDSVRARLEEIRGRIVGGAAFDAMARQFSQDPGSASSGGDLGYFARGDMVAPFEEAALALQPGQVSEVVQTPMGLHLIRVEDRRLRGFDEVSPEFRRVVQNRRVAAAESTFVAALEARTSPEIAEGAFEVTREVATNPGTRLTGRASRRALVEWDGGSVTLGELRTLLQIESPQLRQQVATATDERLEIFLRDVARRELLVGEARSAGLQPAQARVDSLVADAATQLRNATRSLGLLRLDQAPGEPRALAIQRAVEDALAENLAGARPFVPLGPVRFQLRDRASFGIFDRGAGEAIVRIGQLRAQRSLSGLEATPQPDAATPDTVSR